MARRDAAQPHGAGAPRANCRARGAARPSDRARDVMELVAAVARLAGRNRPVFEIAAVEQPEPVLGELGVLVVPADPGVAARRGEAALPLLTGPVLGKSPPVAEQAGQPAPTGLRGLRDIRRGRPVVRGED